MLVANDRRFRFDLPPHELWAAFTQVDRYRSWWPWLHHLEGARFEEGSVWDCIVRPPLPYDVRFSLAVEEVSAPTLVRARITGDVVGRASLQVEALGPDRSEARLVSELAPGHGLLRLVARVALPLARLGHDWVLDRGAAQFQAAVAGAVDPGPGI